MPLASLIQGLGWAGHNWFGGKDRVAAAEQGDKIVGLLEQLAAERNPYTEQANPYDQGNAGLTALLGLQQGAISRQFADGEDDVRRSLAQRGALGSAQETSALRRLALDRSRALSGNEAEMRANTYDKGVNFGLQSLANRVNWDTNRRNALMGGYTNQRDFLQQRGDAPMQALAGIAGLGAKAATAYYTGGASLAAPGGFGAQQPTFARSPLPGGGPYASRDQWGGLL